MRSYVRNALVALLALGLLGWFLSHAELAAVWTEIRRASLMWLAFAQGTMAVNHVIRSWRWRGLLAPIGAPAFSSLFRATVIGFGSMLVLPPRAGDVIRPWVLARREGLNATATFATIVVERLIDLMTVLLLFAVYLMTLPALSRQPDTTAMQAVKAGGGLAAIGSMVLFIGMVLMARHPERLARLALSIERVLPSRVAHAVAHLLRRFAEGLGIVRDPARLAVALAWSILLWTSIAAGIWGVSQAFSVDVPFTGAFLLITVLAVGVMVPTPGAVGGFHEAYRYGTTTFFGASNDAAVGAAIVLHAVTFVLTTLVGIVFAAQDGFSLARAGRAASRVRTEDDSGEVPVLRPSGR